jgi:hypothetical protein
VLALAFNQAAEQQAAVYAAERAREEEANYRHTFTVWLTTENPASLNDRRSPLHPLRVAQRITANPKVKTACIPAEQNWSGLYNKTHTNQQNSAPALCCMYTEVLWFGELQVVRA